MRLVLAIFAAALALAFVGLMLSFATLKHAYAHDRDGKWAALSAAGKAPPKEWWDALGSGKGLCCSFADGQRVEDVDWDTQSGCEPAPWQNGADKCGLHYRVRLSGKWIVVPDSALVTDPNKFGPAVVWPYKDADGVTQIRCFLPGAGA